MKNNLESRKNAEDHKEKNDKNTDITAESFDLMNEEKPKDVCVSNINYLIFKLYIFVIMILDGTTQTTDS